MRRESRRGSPEIGVSEYEALCLALVGRTRLPPLASLELWEGTCFRCGVQTSLAARYPGRLASGRAWCGRVDSLASRSVPQNLRPCEQQLS